MFAVIAIGNAERMITTRYQIGRVLRYATAVVNARKPVICLMPLHASATNIWTPPGNVILFPSHRTGTPVAFITVEATRLASNWSGEAILE